MPPLVASTMRSRSARRRGEHLAEQLLARSEAGAAPVEAVDVGGVDQVQPGVERGLDQRLAPADVVAGEAPLPEGERPDLAERAERGVGDAVDQSRPLVQRRAPVSP